MALGSFGFVENLRKAEVIGVAYGAVPSEVLHARVPQITLIARHGLHLKEAFSEFNAWAEATDGDAVDLTIVFRTDGGYLLGLSPEPERMRRRCLGFDRTHEPTWMIALWCKPIDSVHPLLRQLQRYLGGFPAPLLFGGAEYSTLEGGPLASGAPLRAIEDLRPLLKFDVTFVEEDAIKPNTTPWLLFQVATTTSSPWAEPTKDSSESPRARAQRRALALRTHFPVTLERLRTDEGFGQLCKALRARNVRRWQVVQAACNLILASPSLAPEKPGERPDGKAREIVVERIQGRFETADGTALPGFSFDPLVEQILEDGQCLLTSVGNKRRRYDLASLQAALGSKGLLEGEDPIDSSLALEFPVGLQDDD
jgi:hypothetical protein